MQTAPISSRINRIHNRVRDRVIEIDVERALIITNSYKENETVPNIIKRPLATLDVAKKMTVLVEEDELFVGNRAAHFCGSGINPEWEGTGWAVAEIEAGNWKLEDDGFYHNPPEDVSYAGMKIVMSKETFEDLQSIKDYWTTRRVTCAANAFQPDGFIDFAKLGASSYSVEMDKMALATGHLTPGFEKIINVGYAAIKQDAQAWLDAHEGNLMGDDVDKFMFYKSAVIACDAAITMVRRYGEACLEKSQTTADAERKNELKQMGESLLWISENPARNFWEACQAALLYQLLLHVDSCYPANSFGRFDKYTWPFLEADLKSGALTNEQAQELVDSFFLKANCFYTVAHPFIIMMTGSGNTYQHTTIGGVDPKTGADSSNPVSYMVLETIKRLSLHDPTISLRINNNTPQELWDLAIETSKTVGGLPLFQNDEIIIPALQKELGFSLEDARDYSLIGCQEIVGSGNDYPAPNGVQGGNASIHFGVVLAMALNNGLNPLNGEQCKLQTGYLYEKNSFDEVKQSFEDLARYLFKWHVSMNNYSEYLTFERAPHAALSISMEGCMESGVDCSAGGCKYNSYGGTAPGLATIADSLTAIKYMVFDEKLCTAKELYDAVMANWEGYEALRQTALNKVPRFGNNDAYADEQFTWMMDLYVQLCSECYSTRTDIYKAGLYGAADHIAQGYHTWATPDGRKAGEPIADAASPVQGCDKNGPTAILNSSLKYDQSRFMDGIALNIKIHPSAVETPAEARKLSELTKTYFNSGGLEVQYNVVNADTLRAAQSNPDEYKNLVVRIAGYSAYFVEMNKDLQEDIISRTENLV